MRNDILSHFPYDTPRPVQAEALSTLQREWHNYDVFVVVAPTATGKSPLSIAIADWAGEARILTPTNMLVNQYAAEFPDLPTLRGRTTYSSSWDFQAAWREFEQQPVGATNYHMYCTQLAQHRRKNSRRTLIIDEAHNTIPFLQSWNAKHVWKHKQGYPWWANERTSEGWEEIYKWIRTVDKPTNSMRAIHADMDSQASRYVFSTTSAEWRNGGRVPWEDAPDNKLIRGESYDMPQLEATPVDLRDYPEVLWPGGLVQKVVLLSATISRKDVEQLGLGRRRVLYINCESPIPADQRKIISWPAAAVSRANIGPATQLICEQIYKIAARYPADKGLVHATYDQARLMRKLFAGNDRFLFHDNTDKAKVYQEFRDSHPESGRILIGSGMYEGLDLPYDAGRWQVLAKIPWPSLGEPAVEHLAEEDPEWYTWTTLKLVMQACGRICRTPTDTGTTYILDNSFKRLYNEAQEADLIQSWWDDAIIW